MTQSANPANRMLEGNIKKTLTEMTIPMIFGMIMLMTFGLVDTFFVSLLGTQELAAISFTFPVTFTVISLNIGLGIGTSDIPPSSMPSLRLNVLGHVHWHLTICR